MLMTLCVGFAVAAPLVQLDSFAPLVDAVTPAVLAIRVETSTQEAPESTGSDRELERSPSRSEGSGFVISPSGRVLTNHHVIADAASITARFADGSEVPLTVVGSDRSTDVALLQLGGERSDWPVVELGASRDLRVGDWVVAVGNPLGLGLTVTAGLVSGVGRELGHSAFDQFIQTDAAINHGNSGGPLFDVHGRAVGMNTAIAEGANSVGFAVPIDLILGLLPELEQAGKVQRGFLGIQYQPVEALLGEALGVDAGVVVLAVHPEKPGAIAGIVPGDVVTSVGGAPVSDGETLIEALAGFRPGERVEVEIVRDRRRKTVHATMIEDTDSSAEPPRTEASALGVVFVPANEKVLHRARVEAGVLIDEVFSTGPSARLLRPGDVLVAVGSDDVKTEAEALAALSRRAPGPVALRVSRGGSLRYVAVAAEAAAK